MHRIIPIDEKFYTWTHMSPYVGRTCESHMEVFAICGSSLDVDVMVYCTVQNNLPSSGIQLNIAM